MQTAEKFLHSPCIELLLHPNTSQGNSISPGVCWASCLTTPSSCTLFTYGLKSWSLRSNLLPGLCWSKSIPLLFINSLAPLFWSTTNLIEDTFRAAAPTFFTVVPVAVKQYVHAHTQNWRIFAALTITSEKRHNSSCFPRFGDDSGAKIPLFTAPPLEQSGVLLRNVITPFACSSTYFLG